MTAVKAAELPEGSVVTIKSRPGCHAHPAEIALTRNSRGPYPWTSGHSGPVYSHDDVQEALNGGSAEVVREGWPE